MLVAAPAGFVKTTLLTQWLGAAKGSECRVAWLPLDAGDADLRLFLTNLRAAIQTVESGYEQAADLVELTVADVRRRRQDRTLRDWLVALPDDVVRRRPLLATFMGCVRSLA